MELSVVVPAYREGARIHDNLVRLLGELEQLGSALVSAPLGHLPNCGGHVGFGALWVRQADARGRVGSGLLQRAPQTDSVV